MIIQELVFFYINFIRKNIKNFSPNISNNKKKEVNKIMNKTNKMINKNTNKKMKWKNNNMMNSNNNMTKWIKIKLIINISMMRIMKCKIDNLYIN